MPANNKYISNDTTLRYALSYFVCSVRTSNQAVRGRRAVAFLCKNFVPYGRSLESLKGNKHHGDNTIPSVCVNLDFV